MAAYPNMTCVIQLNSHCWDCINSVRAALSRMYGVTSVIVDSALDTVKVEGKVDPRDLLSVVQSYDAYARILWSKPTTTLIYPYGYGYSYADQYCCGTQPPPISYYQPYWGRRHHSGCNIM